MNVVENDFIGGNLSQIIVDFIEKNKDAIMQIN